jgi:queuine tRNA-ribosyltransferase
VADTNRGKTLSILSSGNSLNSQQRFGQAIVSSGTLNIRHKAFAQDFGPIDKDCTCACCHPTEQGGLGITRAYMYHVAAKETVGAHL